MATVNDDYASNLAPDECAALELTDALIGMPGPLSQSQIENLQSHFTPAELVEISLGVGLFLGMSKVLITLGLEPEDMPITVMPTPGSQA